MSLEVFNSTYQEEIYLVRPRPVVVIQEPWDKLGDKERELLTKIIAALKISIDSVTIVTQSTLDLSSFAGKADRLIYFGDLHAGISRYDVLEAGNLFFICSENLPQLIDNETSRKLLWGALKKLFAI